MNFLGIDYGEKRIGLAFADEVGVATPLNAATQTSLSARLSHIAQLIEERKIAALVVGYPLNMNGSIGFKAKEVDEFITLLEKRFKLPIYRADERLSTKQVKDDLDLLGLLPAKKSGKARQKAFRTGEIDSRAATIILQDYLSSKQD